MLEALPPEPFLGVHVRRGDFRQGGLAIDDAWYIRAVSQALRGAFPDGGRPQIRIFSDAAPQSLRFLAEAFPNVTIQPKAPALLDLLHLSRCAALVGTSRSTFGMWAAFLGQMPSFWHPVETPPLLSVTQRAVVTVVD